MTVIDASAAVDLLIPSTASSEETRATLLAALPEPAVPWLAPDILIFEVFAVLRRHHLRGALSASASDTALSRLRRLPIELITAGDLLAAAWRLRDNLGAADSLYLALALQTGKSLLTTDHRLARAATHAGVDVIAP